MFGPSKTPSRKKYQNALRYVPCRLWSCFCVFSYYCTIPAPTSSSYSKAPMLVHSTPSWFCLLRPEQVRDRAGTDRPISTAGPSMPADTKTRRLAVTKQLTAVQSGGRKLAQRQKLSHFLDVPVISEPGVMTSKKSLKVR